MFAYAMLDISGKIPPTKNGGLTLMVVASPSEYPVTGFSSSTVSEPYLPCLLKTIMCHSSSLIFLSFTNNAGPLPQLNM